MSPEAERVFELASQLTDEEQCALIDQLEIERLKRIGDHHGGFASEEIRKAWAAEIDRRVQDVESGRVKPIPWEQTYNRLKSKTDGTDGG